MLTSRAEYRLLLRHDNADLRLTSKGWEVGLVTPERYARFRQKKELLENSLASLQKQGLVPAQKCVRTAGSERVSQFTAEYLPL